MVSSTKIKHLDSSNRMIISYDWTENERFKENLQKQNLFFLNYGTILMQLLNSNIHAKEKQ